MILIEVFCFSPNIIVQEEMMKAKLEAASKAKDLTEVILQFTTKTMLSFLPVCKLLSVS